MGHHPHSEPVAILMHPGIPQDALADSW